MSPPAPPLETLLETVWPAVRRKHLYPELPAPRLADGGPQAGMHIREKRISISRAFVNRLAANLSPRRCVEALLDHAVSRYLYCPWNLATHLKLYAGAREVLDSGHAARAVTEAFMDIAADTRCLTRVPSPLPDLYRAMGGSPLTVLVKGVLQHVWQKDLGVGGNHAVVPHLASLPYLDRSRWEGAIRRFAGLLGPLVPDPASGGGAHDALLGADPALAPYTSREIAEGFRALAAWIDTPDAFARIAADFGFRTGEGRDGADGAAGVGRGRPEQAHVPYYLKLAENYRLPVRCRPQKASGADYPHHHAPWEAGLPCHDIDPWTSFGRIMPGITQVWKREKSRIYTRREQTPDLLVMIDSSSSMRHPARTLSYAVLGAGCAGDAYLRNGARVAVYNFSDAAGGEKRVTSWTTRRRRVFEAVCHYIGGGTRVRTEDLAVFQVTPPPDIFLITDMQIRNLSVLVDYFKASPSRITVVHIGENAQVRRFRKAVAPCGGLTLFKVERREDIPAIVLGQVRRYLGAGNP